MSEVKAALQTIFDEQLKRATAMRETAQRINAEADDLFKSLDAIKTAQAEVERALSNTEVIEVEEPVVTRGPGTYSHGALPPLAPVEENGS